MNILLLTAYFYRKNQTQVAWFTSQAVTTRPFTRPPRPIFPYIYFNFKRIINLYQESLLDGVHTYQCWDHVRPKRCPIINQSHSLLQLPGQIIIAAKNVVSRIFFSQRRSPPAPVWPDFAKFCHFDKKLKGIRPFLRVYVEIAEVLNLLWNNYNMLLGKMSLLQMAKYWINDRAICSHWPPMLCRTIRKTCFLNIIQPN